DRDGAHDSETCRAHLVRIAQGITNRPNRCTETEDQRLQDSHSQSDARLSAFFLRGVDQYRPVAAGTCWSWPAAAVPPGWRRPEQLSRPRGCICPARSFRVAEWPIAFFALKAWTILTFGDSFQRDFRSLVSAFSTSFYLPCDLISLDLQIKVHRAFTTE